MECIFSAWWTGHTGFANAITSYTDICKNLLVSQTNWKLIGYHNLKNELFNNSLYKSISGRTKYSNYNRHILEDGKKTAPINIQKNKGWFHFSCNSLLPLIKERDALLSDLPF